MLKKLVATILSASMLMGISSTAFAAESPSNDMDTLDLIIAAGSYLNSTAQEEQCIDVGTFIDSSIPLFSPSGETVAYYVTFSPSGYAVVNNNSDNPTVIEFGVGGSPAIDEILAQSNGAHIIYNNPVDVYDANASTDGQARATEEDIYAYYPDLKQANHTLASQHKAQRESILQQQHMLRGDGDFGFVDASAMPSGSYTSDTILSATSTDWATMDEFDSIANNHCGATAVTNLALYFAQRGSSDLKINNHTDTFKAVHEIVGNGSVMMIAGSAETYFEDRGYALNFSTVSSFTGIKSAIGNNRPCGILLAEGIVSWHWILCVGYREYSNAGGNYMRIMDGWFDNINRYYKVNTGSAWISATEYWV